MSLFLGNHIIRLHEVDSTNNFAHQLLATNNAFDGTVITAKNQLAGRGQRGNDWYSEPEANLLFSIILKDAKTLVENRFYLNMAVALGIHEYLSRTLAALHNIQIKWPNDLLVNNKKIAGVLLENAVTGNTIANSVIGIGLNVNQQQFIVSSNGREATSLSKCEQKHFVLEACLQELLTCLEKYILLFRKQQFQKLSVAYHNVLYQKDEMHPYLLNGETIRAVIKQVDEKGLLMLETETNQSIACTMQELRFLT